MSDGVAITSGTGTTIATDDVGSAHYQKIKIDAGGDGVSVPIVAGQQLKAASVPVVLASDQGALPVSDNSTTLSVDDGGGALTVDGTVAVSAVAGNVAVTGTFWQATQPVSIATAPALVASDAVIGLVGSSDIVVTVTPTCDTNAYASGDLLFDSTAIANAVRANAGICILQSLTLLDKDDQGVSMTLVFANAETDFGTLNAAPDPDDTECATILGTVEIAAGDYVDFGAARVATLTNLGLMMKAGAATTSLYVAGIVGTGTPTHSASGLVLQLAFIRS